MSILPEELQSFEYYKGLTPMYLQNVHGFLDQIKIWFNLCMLKSNILTCGTDIRCGAVAVSSRTDSIVSVIDEIFAFLDIFNTSGQHLSESADILDKLAALFGVSRQFSVTIEDEKKQLNLSDNDLLILIKCQVIKNFFNGTYEHLMRCFEIVNLPIMPLTDTQPAHCKMYMLLQDENEVSQNVKDMFLSGMLSVESMGIYYTYAIQIAQNIAIFDSLSSTAVFDVGQFII